MHIYKGKKRVTDEKEKQEETYYTPPQSISWQFRYDGAAEAMWQNFILYIYIYIETVEIIILSAAAVILIKSGTSLSISHDDKRLYTTYIPLGRDKFGSKTAWIGIVYGFVRCHSLLHLVSTTYVPRIYHGTLQIVHIVLLYRHGLYNMPRLTLFIPNNSSWQEKNLQSMELKLKSAKTRFF